MKYIEPEMEIILFNMSVLTLVSGGTGGINGDGDIVEDEGDPMNI